MAEPCNFDVLIKNRLMNKYTAHRQQTDAECILQFCFHHQFKLFAISSYTLDWIAK